MQLSEREELKRYLIIDDDNRFRDRLSRLLEQTGSVVQAVASAEEALALGCKVDRILLDLKLGPQSGADFIKPLRECFPGALIVVLTGFGSIPTAVRCMQLGARQFLTKPVGIVDIETAFRAEGVLRQHASPIPSLEEVEREHIRRVLDECDGNISRAAKALGLHRRSLQRKLQKS